MPCDYHELPHQGIRSLNPYIPGKSIDELAREKGLTDIIKLASNENQMGCSPHVLAALAQIPAAQLATYPSPANHPLHGRLSDFIGVPPSMLTLCNGSDTLFSLLLTLFGLHRKKHMLTHDLAFISYSIQAQILGIPTFSTPVGADYQVDIDTMIEACNDDTGIIFLANPNNPTGLLIEPDAIKQLLDSIPSSTIVVLDEAYYEFAYPPGDTSTLRLLNAHPNLVITRTFSKAYGLAGLRLGYAIATPEISELISRIQLPFVVNQAALEAAYAALDDLDFVRQTLIMTTQGMRQMHAGLKKLNLNVLPSKGNFLTFDCGMNGLLIYEALLDQGIIVRPLIAYGLTQHLRVSISSSQQNARFLTALSACLEEYRTELKHEI